MAKILLDMVDVTVKWTSPGWILQFEKDTILFVSEMLTGQYLFRQWLGVLANKPFLNLDPYITGGLWV